MAVFDFFSEEKRRGNATYRPACTAPGKNDLFPNFFYIFYTFLRFCRFCFFCVFAVFASFCILDRPKFMNIFIISSASTTNQNMAAIECRFCRRYILCSGPIGLPNISLYLTWILVPSQDYIRKMILQGVPNLLYLISVSAAAQAAYYRNKYF